jgi:riboflavin kinase
VIVLESLEEKEWFLLFYLSKMGALQGISKTTTELAEELPPSQQTISRRLNSLREKGFIMKTIKGSDVLIKITESGKLVLNQVYQDLKNALIEKAREHYYGHVQTGLGEGKFYVQLPEYNVQFTNILKKPPFPGTLNIVLESENLEDFYYSLSQQHFVTIDGFESSIRSYGSVKCFKVHLSSNGESKDEVECFLVDIRRTSHQKGTIEIVSSLNLRNKLQLADGSIVRVSFCE